MNEDEVKVAPKGQEEVKVAPKGQEEVNVIKTLKTQMGEMVSKEEYNRIKEKADAYAEMIITGEVKQPEVEEKEVDINELIQKHNTFNGSNREYAKLTVKAIDAMCDMEFDDNTMSQANLDNIMQVKYFFEQAIENSETDAEFIAYYEKNVTDSNPMMSRQIAAAGGLQNYLVKNNKVN